MIFRLYFATVALASLGLILLAVVPDAFRIPVLVICIVIMLTIVVVSVTLTGRESKWLIYYIVKPIRELEDVAEHLSHIVGNTYIAPIGRLSATNRPVLQ